MQVGFFAAGVLGVPLSHPQSHHTGRVLRYSLLAVYGGRGTAVASFGRLLVARARKAMSARGCRFAPSREMHIPT